MLLGVLSIIIVVAIWVLEVYFELSPLGSPPVFYDLALAYLAGWIFYLLVEALPKRRKHTDMVRYLRGPLMTIANNGQDLIRDLEFIGECPEKKITPEHIERVLTANNHNVATTNFIAERLAVVRDAYRNVTPFFAMLPGEIAVAVHRVDHAFINVSMNAPERFEGSSSSSEEEFPVQPQDMRKPHPIFTTTKGKPTKMRMTLKGDLVRDCYDATERVRCIVSRYISGPSTERHSERVLFWVNHRLNAALRHPAVKQYPQKAYSDVWIDDKDTL